MATNLDLDDKLIREAVKLGKFKTKKEAVTAALTEFVKKRQQASLTELFGTIDFHPDWDYKKMRRRRRGAP